MASRPAWTCRDDGSGILTTAIHAGHELRGEVDAAVALDARERAREEDLHTDRFAEVTPTRIVVHRSRFEVDLNRPREHAVYRTPEQAWGLDVWRAEPSPDLVRRSLHIYDRFYRTLDRLLRHRVEAGQSFVVLDLHSYNHRRAGPSSAPEPTHENPDLNIGTGSLDRDRWGTVVDELIASFRTASGGLDVRENVRFRGGHMSKWINGGYARHGCCLALEFKKTYLDEWTGVVYGDRMSRLISAFGSVVSHLEHRVAAA